MEESGMKPFITVEVCSGSVQDCIYAEQAGANRIELNSGLYLGGLTPSIATLIEAKKEVGIPIIAMVRPRAGGFFYNNHEKETMFTDAKLLIQYGVDGIVFGFLNEDRSIDETNTKALVDLCHKNQVEAIFHRAFDQTPDAFKAIETLISCKVDRILTSGQKKSADQGIELLRKLQEKYGTEIELCAGAGVNKENVQTIIEETKINQVHSSFKKWYKDPTTEGKDVSYRYSDQGDYEGVGVDKLDDFMKVLN